MRKKREHQSLIRGDHIFVAWLYDIKINIATNRQPYEGEFIS